MGRHRKTGLAEDLIELIATLPWWVGVGLAIAAYVVFSSIAAQPIVISSQPGQIGTAISTSIWKAVASAARYIAPFICLAGAGISVYKRHERKQLVTDVVRGRATDVLDGMTWQQFEMLVGEAFRLKGFQVVETGGGGADGGIDLVLSKPSQNGRERYLVQCKQWRALKVGVDVVRELYGVMAARGAAGGFVVTSGRFTDEAVQFATGLNVTLIDGPNLQRMIRDVRGATSGHPQFGGPESTSQTTADRAPPVAPPICPKCGKAMTRRTAKRGANVGGIFWGCTAYPACRGTRPVE